MQLAYIVSSRYNLLYNGNFLLNNSYKTYGQHSFIYDLLVVGKSKGLSITVYVDDCVKFPLSKILTYHGIEVIEVSNSIFISADIIFFDKVDKQLINRVKTNGKVIGLIHNHLNKEDDSFYDRCHKVICLTKNAKRHQSEFCPIEKIEVIRQGVNLNRFKAFDGASSASKRVNSVLIYSRMDSLKGRIYSSIVERLLCNNLDVTVLGDGEHFWEIVNNFHDKVLTINYIPCYNIHRFINRFDLVISNGRGVMEALACGIPTIAAGIGFGGLISQKNIEFLFERNFTGSNISIDNRQNVNIDIEEIKAISSKHCRDLAEKKFDISFFIERLKE